MNPRALFSRVRAGSLAAAVPPAAAAFLFRAAAAPETNRGPHRSATPKDMQMNNIKQLPLAQQEPTFIKEGFIKFTPAQANFVIENCRYERQRDELKAAGHIATLSEYMRRGQWLPKSQIDFARMSDGRVIMVNGHHRMRAQVAATCDILWSVVIHDCATDADLRSLYYRFDTDLRPRSAQNILSGIDFAGQTGLTKQASTALWNAVPIIANGLRFKRYDQGKQQRSMLTDERLEMAMQYAVEAAKMHENIMLAPPSLRRQLYTVSNFAVALVTLKFDTPRAETFWRGVCEDDGLTKGDPRKTLLADIRARQGKDGLLASKMMAAAKAWNAYRAGRELKIIKVTGHSVCIDGTPFTVSA
jgi:hypothetical protein